jgi:hypothetical protein
MAILDTYDVIIIGAGAAGLICAIEAGKRGRKVMLFDHAKKPAEKIRISGGGRCNFTNLNIRPEAYLSNNPHFFKSALKQYTQHDFIALVEAYKIPYHEKTLGQLFCDTSAKDIINMLLNEAETASVELYLETKALSISHQDNKYTVETTRGTTNAASLVIATGGPSIPKMGASGYAYDIARQFNLNIIEPCAALVPLTFEGEMLEYCKSLAGVAVPSIAKFKKQEFREAMLFTHRGLSGPSVLQISSYWDHKNPISFNMAPDMDVYHHLITAKAQNPKTNLVTALSQILPKRLAEKICTMEHVSGNIADAKDSTLKSIADDIQNWCITPDGTEGYRTAEVTLGGIDTDELSSKTMETKKHAGLFFIGECVDVTGHLGGYNFQWAWSSGYVAGQNV